MAAPTPSRTLTPGQRAYEARRAAKAGISLDKWLAQKDKEEAEAKRSAARSAKEATKAAKPPGFIRRLLEKAHKPL